MAAYIGTSKDITTERHLPLRPGGDVAPPFPTFTDEETAVLRALINAHAEAARERARLVDGLVRVTAIGNSIAYDDAKSEIAVASRPSEALMLAIELAGWTFNQRAIERSDRLNVEPFENTPSFAGGTAIGLPWSLQWWFTLPYRAFRQSQARSLQTPFASKMGK